MGCPVVLKPRLGSCDGPLLFFRDWLAVDEGVGNGDGRGIGHHFEQPNHGHKLTGVKLVEQLMGVLFVHILSFTR
jgi:hypothetical protein